MKSVNKAFGNARVIARKAVAKLPASSIDGFHRGRKAGHDAISNAPLYAGAAVGFVYGAGEAVIGGLVASVSCLIACAHSFEPVE